MNASKLQHKPWWEALRAGSIELAETKVPSWLPFAVVAIPALLLLIQLVSNWVNIPYWDEWRLIAHLRIAMATGTLRPLDVFAQHNDSRFLVPQLILLPLARVTHWDVRAEMLVIFATVCLISWVLWGLLGKIENLPRPVRFGCLLFCNCLLFSPLQYETWLWGIMFSVVLPPLFLLLALQVNLSALSLPAKVGLNIFLCFASTFSNANGMGNWVLAFPAFVHRGARPDRRWFWYSLYFAAAIGTLVLFFCGYQSHVSPSPLVQSPGLLLKYFFCILGAPVAIALGTSAWLAGVCLSFLFLGLSGAGLFWPVTDRRQHAAYAFTAIGCYSGLAAAATALGRVGLRFEWALGSRYTTFSLYLPIAVIGLAALHFARPDDRSDRPNAVAFNQIIAGLIVFAILAGSLGTYEEGMKGMSRTRRERARGRAALLFSRVLPHNPDLKILWSNPAMMIARYRELVQCGMAWTHFVAPSSIPKLQPRRGISRSSGYFRVCELKGHRLRMKGWAMLEGRRAAPFVLFARRTKGTEAVPFSVAPTGNQSPKGAPRDVHDCGFEIKLDAPDLPAGRTEISAWAIDPEQNEIAQLEHVHELHVPVPASPNRERLSRAQSPHHRLHETGDASR